MKYRTRAVATAIALAAMASSSIAGEPSDRDRTIHASAIAVGGAGYLVVQLGFARQLAAHDCRWCDVPGLDSRTRAALRWGDTDRADVLSSVTGYALAPAALLGLTAYGDGLNVGWRRRFDDVVPVVESVIVVSLMHHVVKFAVGRQRPYAHYDVAGTVAPTKEDNVSFFSGHTSLAFGLAISAGQVATLRGYAIAPAVWTLGISLAVTTGYLRIAADRHYLSDVLVGAAAGSAIGYLWPRYVTRYLQRPSASVVPTSSGVAIIGTF